MLKKERKEDLCGREQKLRAIENVIPCGLDPFILLNLVLHMNAVVYASS